jgi:[ribosomal protein S5]-alanine N-acetyltransferase
VPIQSLRNFAQLRAGCGQVSDPGVGVGGQSAAGSPGSKGGRETDGSRCGRLSQVILRDMTEEDLDVLFDIQDDDIARHMAAFTNPDGGERDSYVAKWRKIIANDEITKKVILVDSEVVGSVGSFAVEGDTEVTYWIRRDMWGRGIATAALAELLREVTVRPLFARAAAANAGSARVLLSNGFTRVGEETSYAEARGAEITEYIYRRDDPPTAR